MSGRWAKPGTKKVRGAEAASRINGREDWQVCDMRSLFDSIFGLLEEITQDLVGLLQSLFRLDQCAHSSLPRQSSDLGRLPSVKRVLEDI